MITWNLSGIILLTHFSDDKSNLENPLRNQDNDFKPSDEGDTDKIKYSYIYV